MKEKMMKNQIKREECRNWFCSHIVVIAVVCFALGLFLSSCHFAKAVSAIPESDLDFYIDKFNEITGGQYAPTYSDFDGYDYSFCLINEDEGQICVYAIKYDNFVFKSVENINTYGWRTRQLGGSDNDDGLAFKNDTWIAGNTDCVKYFYYGYNNNLVTNYYVGTYRSIYGNWSEGGYRFDCANITGSYNKYSYFPQSSNGSSDIYIGSNTTLYYSGYSTYTSYGTLQGEITEELSHVHKLEQISFVSDSRLKFATWSDAIGRSILHVDMTDYLNSTGFNISNTTLNDFTLSIDYSIQNSEDTENHTISFNNSSQYFMEYGENGKLTKVYMNIPYTEFYGFNYDTNSFPDYDDVIIQNAIVNLDLVPVGGNTSINITSYVDCLYYLQHVYDDIVPEVLPLPEYEDTFVQDAQQLVDSINQLYAGSSFYTDGDFTFSSPIALPDWADVWEYDLTYATIGSDNEFLGDFYPYPYDVNGGSQVQDVNDIIYEFSDEKYAYYDVVRLRVFRARINSDIDVSVTYLDTVYIYLYTERYFLRKDALTNIDILKMLQQSASNDVAFFESIRERVDDFEEKTLVAITGDENSVFAYINSLDSDLNSGIQRIIDNMPVFNWSPFNDDDILNALYTIVANQNSPHDGYARYISWVKDEQTSGGFGKWANDMFDVFHDAYDFFNYQDDINPNETGLQQYIDYVKLYMQYLIQGDEGILPAQSVYYKGIFDNTYDLHNVNGRGG